MINLLTVLCEHNDHLAVSTILMGSKINHGLALPPLDVLETNFTENLIQISDIEGDEEDAERDEGEKMKKTAKISDEKDEEDQSGEDDENSLKTEVKFVEKSPSSTSAAKVTTVADLTKALIRFISARKNQQPLWQYEDITRNVWNIKSAEQMDVFLQNILQVFERSLSPHTRLAERWAQLSLQLALSCSSRHYAGRSLQIFRALRVPITSRMLSDILSRWVPSFMHSLVC